MAKKPTVAKNSPSQEEDLEIKRLRAANEDWKEYDPKWKFYLSAYEGGEAFIKSDNIFKHVREVQSDYEDRLKRAHNMNYCEPLVDFFTNFIFTEVIDRNGGNNAPFYSDFKSNVNRRGDNIDSFMRQVSDDDQIFGMSYIIVDMPKVDTSKLLTKQDQIDANIMPYWTLVKPTEFIDWVVDDFGVLQYMKRKQMQRKVAGDGTIRELEHYTEFYPDHFDVTDIDVTIKDEIQLLPKETTVNQLGEIPIVIARYKRSKETPFMGLSFLRDFAYNNREILNLTSLIDEFLYRQCFNILAIPTDSSIELGSQHEGNVGTANALTFPMGGKAPEYISPPVDPAKFIQEERSRIKNEMFTRAAQDALNELYNGEGSSGFSQAQSFSKTVPFISSRADELELTETRLMELTMKWLNKEWDGKIKYKDRYELTNFTDALTQFQMLARDLQLPSETFVKEELKRLYHEYDGKLSDDLVAKINKEIDAMDFKGWMETQKEALVGGQGNSPGDQQKPKSKGTTAEAAAEGNNQTSNAATNKVKKK